MAEIFCSGGSEKDDEQGFQASIFRTFDGIPKHQYIADLACIKKIRQYIDAGECVLMCPEGKVTMDGRNGFLSASVAKLIKWLKVPVVFVHTHGSALTFPKWAVVGGFRRGECVTESRVLFTAEQTVSLSEDEIYEKLSAAFTFNDYEYQDVNNIKFKTKIPAMGISGLLYKCPKCNSEYVNTTDSHMIKCSECGNTAIIDVYGRITAADDTSVAYDRPDRWVDFQKAEIEKEIEAPDFCLTEDVVLYIEDDISASYIKRAAGKLFLSREGIRFKVDEYFIGEGFYNDEIFYPIQNLATLGPEYDDIFLTSGNKTYQYAFAGKNRTYRWTWTTEAIHRMLFHNDREY